MSNMSFYNGATYVRDYILSSLVGFQNEIRTDNWREDPEYQAYQKVYDLIVDKVGGSSSSSKDDTV